MFKKVVQAILSYLLIGLIIIVVLCLAMVLFYVIEGAVSL